MKRWKKIGIGILLVLVAAVIGLGVWQQENIKALYTFLTNDSERISQNLQDKQQVQQETLEKDFNITVQAPTIDISNDLLDGKISPDEVKQSLGIIQATQPAPPTQEGQSEPAGPAVSEETEQPGASVTPEDTQMSELTEEERRGRIEDLVNQCVAELYACEIDLMAQLGEMKQVAVDEWKALRPKQRTKAKKYEIGFAGLEECYKLEVVVDAQVNSILDRYEAPILELGGDAAVLDGLWVYYCEKKVSQKAYYLDKYLD